VRPKKIHGENVEKKREREKEKDLELMCRWDGIV